MSILLKGFAAVDGDLRRRAILIGDDGKIAAVEKDICGSSAADRQLIFKDEIIAPGFIDVHSHSDISLPAAPDGFSKRSQGITAEVSGNCGLSPFPLTPHNREHLQELYANYQFPLTWSDFDSYSKMLDSRKCALRLFPLCGHNTLRAAVAGYEQQHLSTDELQKMCSLLQQMLLQGAVGLSTGLLYTPGCFAEPDELIALMKTVQHSGKVYATHLKSEGDQLLESLTETLSLAQKAGLAKVEISHFKTAGEANWSKLDEALEIINRFRNSNLDIRFDRYPYTESQTQLSVLLPSPCDTMSDRDITVYLAEPANFAELLEKLRRRDQQYWQRMRLVGTDHPVWKKFAGKKFVDFTGDPPLTVLEILRNNAVSATVAAAGMSEKNMLQIILDERCLPGSDGNALPPDCRFGTPHPRSFGTLPRFIRLLLDHNIPPAEVCDRVSRQPAEFFALPQLGKLRRGYHADITVFDPETVDSSADFTAPTLPAQGITMTMLGGQAEFY